MRKRLRLTAALVVATATVAATGTAFADGASRVSAHDPTGDFQLLHGHRGARSASIDIESMRWARSRGDLRVGVVIRELRADDLNQYAVFRALDPATGRRLLVQASTLTPVAHVATGSWVNRVDCPRATTRLRSRRDGTGTITASVPLRCLGRPRKLKRLTVQTVAQGYYMGRYLSQDFADTDRVLRLR